MKFLSVIRIIGLLLVGLAVAIWGSALVSLFYGEEDLFALLSAGVVTMGCGGALFVVGGHFTERMAISHKGAFAVVTFGWLVSCMFGALPYYFYAHLPAIWYGDAPEREAGDDAANLLVVLPDCDANTGLGREFCSYTNCMFESVSGFTTTGATILEAGLWNQVDSRKGGLPHGLLFWRAVTHLLGGMGIIVFGVALLPLLGIGGMQLFKAEVPGPVKDKVAPRVAETARLLWIVYAALILIEIVLLMFSGQGLYLSACHAFATMATGGFSPLSSSIESLSSPYSEWVIIIFMFLAGANFNLHFGAIRRRRFIHWRDQEFRFYTIVTVVLSVVLAQQLLKTDTCETVGAAVRSSFFQVLTMLTTTGFSTTNFDNWAVGAKLILFLTFFIGGSSGSTGGGIKCVRVFLMAELAKRELRRLVHPHGVMRTKLSGSTVPIDVINSVAGFVVLYLGIYFTSVIFYGLYGYDFESSLTVVGATLGNIGPGFGAVGPAANYNFFGDGFKWHQIFLMLAGRLELYSVLIVLTPEFWKK